MSAPANNTEYIYTTLEPISLEVSDQDNTRVVYDNDEVSLIQFKDKKIKNF